MEEPILDLKGIKFTDLVEAWIIFNQATWDKAKKEENDIKRLGRRISKLEEKIELEISDQKKIQLAKGLCYEIQ